MNILIPIKMVVDSHINVHVKNDGSGIELNNIKMSINPFDEIAVEEAVRLKELGKAKEIIVVSIGPRKAEDILRHALAMGATRAILIESDEDLEPLAIAKLLKKVIEEEQPKIVIAGKKAIDDEACQTGQMIAGLMGWSQATFASKIEIDDNHAIVTREIDGGTHTIKINLPAVITTELNLNEPRYMSLLNIIKAKKQSIERKLSSNFSIDLTARLKVLSIEKPCINRKSLRLNSITELFEKLKNKSSML
ncbi:Electron transfer flavoprotein, beta subunit [Liberibacter crescens BT-1]|uniref:Electron transfer flavoprotein subunit beta n=1 Tax=Liberibacter crescens (strain BT-1) TaxID=1215343 RepID=L0EUZ1_LIBCB|nr:electron transfer flavoprotein subunit beta/FixA family protein [Liberibacter crescens]AGA64206.1 Electron transfer flavoprotein, beta subunit [Liberibacter crescens BT-1]AMC12458.1 electron transfer flavoprotein subunit beta [Liberibacter crescens]